MPCPVGAHTALGGACGEWYKEVQFGGYFAVEQNIRQTPTQDNRT